MSQAKITRHRWPSDSCFMGIVCAKANKCQMKSLALSTASPMASPSCSHLLLACESVSAHSSASSLDLKEGIRKLLLHKLQRRELEVEDLGKVLVVERDLQM